MCFAEGSLEYTTSTCKMCMLMKTVYRKPHTVCPHKGKMQVCRNRVSHPRADFVHYGNAEIRTFNGCGYCKWADSHPEQRGKNNPGWPGCCRAPTAVDYAQYIKQEDWIAVSSLFSKLNRSAGSDEGLKQQVKDDTTPTKRIASRSKASPAPRSTSPARARNGESIVRSSSPLAGNSTTRRDIQHQDSSMSPTSNISYRTLKDINTRSSSLSTSHSPSEDSPDTPPARAKELNYSSGSSGKRADSSEKTSGPVRDISMLRYSPIEADQTALPVRQTITIQSQSLFYPPPVSKNNDEPTSPVMRYKDVATTRSTGNSPRLQQAPITPSVPDSRPDATPRRERLTAPHVEIIPIPSRPLPEERTPRIMAGAKFTTSHSFTFSPAVSASDDFLSAKGPSSSSSSSSSSNSSNSSAEDSSSSHSGAGGGYSDSTTRRGGGSSSSDFTDFLSDDSDYELERQAEERAAQVQRQRIERAEDREFRDAQQTLELIELTESMDLAGSGMHNSTNNMRRGAGMLDGVPSYSQTIYTGRYR